MKSRAEQHWARGADECDPGEREINSAEKNSAQCRRGERTGERQTAAERESTKAALIVLPRNLIKPTRARARQRECERAPRLPR